MRRSPSIVPGNDQEVYLVLDDFCRLGSAWRETNVEDTDLESVINDLLDGVRYRAEAAAACRPRVNGHASPKPDLRQASQLGRRAIRPGS